MLAIYLNKHSADEEVSMSSLKSLAIRGASWSFVGYGTSQFLRLGSNLVLTRLLFPEVFGLSALVTVFLVGLQMFSDVGIGPSIIQNDRGDEPVFLNTAWTIQVFRGIAVWICACLGAIPFANFYDEPQLSSLIMVSGFSAVISGFNSTSLFTANKHLDLKGLTLIEIGSQLGALCVMIVWAIFSPTVWVVVAGGLVGSTLKMFASHLLLSGIKNTFTWDPKSLKELLRFGQWIFISTIIGFTLGNADSLIMGKFLSFEELGVFSVAAMIAKVVEKIYSRLSNQVLFPIYSKLKHLSAEDLRKRIKRVRLSVMCLLLPPLWILVILGDKIIAILYDPRYHEAGWMLQILSSGYIVLISSAIGPFYLAFGNSFLFMQLLAIKAFLLLGALFVGGYFFGAPGLIVGMAATHILFYPVQVIAYRRYNLWIPVMDFLAFLVSLFVIFIGLWLKGFI